eukprot:sb/3464952/
MATEHMPIPHYKGEVPLRLREVGLKILLSIKYRYNRLKIVDDLSTPDRYLEPAEFQDILRNQLGVPGSCLLITGNHITPHFSHPSWTRREPFPAVSPGAQRLWQSARITTAAVAVVMLGEIACVDEIEFEIEMALNEQRGILPLPFPKMDKSSASICKFFQRGVCYRDISCPFRHTSGPKTVVCKHWLRGLCKKGDDCEYLHEYDMTKMPECYFFSKYGECSNKDCQYLHIDPNSKLKDCPWYDRGFCKHGPSCRNRHIRRVMCTNYMSGFCPLGPKCKSMHPRFELPKVEVNNTSNRIRCHHCNEPGHVVTHCPLRNHLPNQPASVAIPSTVPDPPKFTPPTSTMPDTPFNNTLLPVPTSGSGGGGHLDRNNNFVKPLENVTCFKCGEKGHYANNLKKAKGTLILADGVAFFRAGPPPERFFRQF